VAPFGGNYEGVAADRPALDGHHQPRVGLGKIVLTHQASRFLLG
jgi:hypothetical protein